MDFNDQPKPSPYERMSPAAIRKEIIEELDKTEEALFICRRKDGRVVISSLGEDKLVVWALARTMWEVVSRDFGPR